MKGTNMRNILARLVIWLADEIDRSLQLRRSSTTSDPSTD
jgi:hypothetical protein